MAVNYTNTFPVAFSEQEDVPNLLLSSNDFQDLSNSAEGAPYESDVIQVTRLLDDLHAIRAAQQSTGGEIRIYGRSLNTSEALLKTIHPKIRKDNFVEVIGLSDPKQQWKNYPWPRVAISKSGVLTKDDQELLYSGLDKKVLVMMSGGEGRSDQPFYRPIAQLMQELLAKEIYTWAVCMSYQVLADQVVCLGIKPGQHVPPPHEGRFHIGTQVVDLTEHGKVDPVFSTVAPAFAVESWNHYRVYGAGLTTDKPAKHIRILARDRASKEVIAFKVGETCWAIQYHPELKKMARVDDDISGTSNPKEIFSIN